MTTATDLIFVDEWAAILRHMLGAATGRPGAKPGYRNFYCAVIGDPKHDALLVMETNGLVKQGSRINGGRDQYFHATRKGCEYIRLGRTAIKRAMSP